MPFARSAKNKGLPWDRKRNKQVPGWRRWSVGKVRETVNIKQGCEGIDQYPTWASETAMFFSASRYKGYPPGLNDTEQLPWRNTSLASWSRLIQNDQSKSPSLSTVLLFIGFPPYRDQITTHISLWAEVCAPEYCGGWEGHSIFDQLLQLYFIVIIIKIFVT